MNIPFIYLLIALLSSYGSGGRSRLSQPISTPQCKHWVDSVYNSMDERERVGQLMIANVSPAQGQASRAAVKRMVEQAHVGGLLFSAGTLEEFADITNYGQELAKVPLMMTLDGEWGLNMRVPDSPRFPKNMGLGAIQNPKLLYEYGQEMARQCRAMGIHVNFAPVVDVNSNPSNPVIGYRSFGESPARVAKLSKAYSLGLEDGGVLAVAKHFPGHGDTNTDSHKALPVVNRSRDSLERVELLPFREFINSGCGGMMVGHISLPALDATGVPASMSRAITTGLLKDELGFDGLVFTDGLGMDGAAIGGNRCVGALKAGADVLLNPVNPVSDVDAVLAAVESGEISAQDIEERCKKMLAYKYALGLADYQPIDMATVDSVVNSSDAEAIIEKLADASATVLRNNDSLLPLGDLAHRSIAVVNIGANGSTEFDQMAEKYVHIDVYHGVGALNEIKKHDTVIAAVYGDEAESRSQLAALAEVPGLIEVFMVNPYKMGKFRASMPNAQAIVAVYDDTPANQRSAAKAIFGGIKVRGRFPVDVAGVGRLGQGIDLDKTRLGYGSLQAAKMDPSLEQKIDSAITEYIKEGAFPGCQILVAREGNVVIDKSYGVTTKGGPAVDGNTLYDLASVSKVVGTLPGVMKAYDLGLFSLDTFASEYIPGLKIEGKDSITPRQLLFHETGIRPSLNLYTIMIDSTCYKGTTLLSGRKDKKHPVKILDKLYGVKNPKLRTDILSKKKTDVFNREVADGLYMSQATADTIMRRIYELPLRNNRNYAYSCLNFALLMDMEQRLTGQPHDQWVTDSVWAPLGAYTFTYRAADKYPLSRIAATENDSYLRRQHVHGYVHDELAAFSGGVQGNAGVFGTATDIAKLCQMWLNQGEYGDARILSPETAHLFTTVKSPNSRRGLGFDKPDVENTKNNPTTDAAGPNVYGHTGFTGTCFWVDPDEELIYVFLCNRVDPTRDNSTFSKLNVRDTLFDLIYQSIRQE